VEGVSLQVGDLEGLHFLVCDLDAALVGAGVEFRLDGQPGLGGGRGDGLDLWGSETRCRVLTCALRGLAGRG
jgi:hypothetical protein